ncbi:unnamed protein product [Nippostrongylus brasiliensis]|uniref:Bestrophin homolog n=1 Tax=Nippostrongylus brasiliensis TaxID=27835 RepID=A0A0N4Y733_NIPBR|nr:unnamed protein product [Nippostrongylus brasiliensis]
MTISYSDTFVKLLFRWKGSLWKAIWRHLLVFLFIYYSINTVYRFLLTSEQQQLFMKYVVLFDSWTKEIPLTFLLGFYVAMIIRRWWDCCQLISWPDHLLYNVSALIRGHDVSDFVQKKAIDLEESWIAQPETRIIRKTIARYAILSSVLAWRSISLRVLTRYPTDEHLLDSGLMNKDELELFKSINVRIDPHQLFIYDWIAIPLVYTQEENLYPMLACFISSLQVLLTQLETYRSRFARLFLYDWIVIPLVYTQVSTISVYGYFAFALIGRQFPSQNEYREVVDMYVPIFTILQFLFYVGWLKVGEDLMFPFGADDEDFEFNYILERNLELLHTNASIQLSNHPQRQHLRKYRLKQDAMEISREASLRRNERKDPKPSLPPSKPSALSFTDLDYMANGPREKKDQS